MLYLCNPEKNTECNKSECYINGGECKFTHRKEFRKSEESVKEQLIEAARLIREHCDHSPNCEGCPFMEDWVGICGVKNAYPSGWYIEGDNVNG